MAQKGRPAHGPALSTSCRTSALALRTAPEQACDEGYDKEYDCNPEQKPCAFHCGSSDTAEAEKCCDEGYDQKDDGVMEKVTHENAPMMKALGIKRSRRAERSRPVRRGDQMLRFDLPTAC